MYTLCPHCETVHPLNARVLAQASGRVKCGRCQQYFNALDSLYDEVPSGRTGPADRRPAPQTPQLGTAPAEHEKGPEVDLSGIASPGPHKAWYLGLVLMIALTWFNLDRMISEPAKIELQAPDTDRIHLVTRDIHAHPTRAGVLVLSATFVNLDSQAQPYPVVTVTLMDPENHPIAAREFEPGEYLASAPGPSELLQPDQHVPILIEFADPGDQAVGFELQFN